MMEEDPKNISSENKTTWNKREEKRPLILYILLALFCLTLAYVLSGTAH